MANTTLEPVGLSNSSFDRSRRTAAGDEIPVELLERRGVHAEQLDQLRSGHIQSDGCRGNLPIGFVKRIEGFGQDRWKILIGLRNPNSPSLGVGNPFLTRRHAGATCRCVVTADSNRESASQPLHRDQPIFTLGSLFARHALHERRQMLDRHRRLYFVPVLATGTACSGERPSAFFFQHLDRHS